MFTTLEFYYFKNEKKYILTKKKIKTKTFLSFFFFFAVFHARKNISKIQAFRNFFNSIFLFSVGTKASRSKIHHK